VIGGFMEMSALLHVLFTTPSLAALPRVVDFSIDYLRAGKMTETYAECSVVRQGRKIVNVSITAWQTTRDKPIATARVHFLLPA
jgi:acyl-coenzyme A thioesterase PaaI-like protein